MKERMVLITLLTLIHSGCGDDKASTDTTTGTDAEYAVNDEYVGDWTQTYFAQYDGDACSGDPTFEETDSGMTYTLSDDGSVLISGSLGCDDTTNASNEMCQSTWGANGSTIRIGQGLVATEFTVGTDTDGSTIMTSEVQGQYGSSQDDMSPMCQYYKFTLLAGE
ncbi:MAG: hypothetical protein VX278_13230 [Myxococcota bacterium]|nr:hypothetical protein [Myxococcota bacterium]